MDKIKNRKEEYFCILNKIKHKPIILESIFALSKSRPYIIIDLITKDNLLKISLNKVFENTKKRNDLPSELNRSIDEYIIYRNRNIKDNFPYFLKNIKNNISILKENLNGLSKSLTKDGNKILESQEIEAFLKNIIAVDNKNLYIGIIEEYIDKHYTKNVRIFLSLYYSAFLKGGRKYYYFFNNYFDNNYNYLNITEEYILNHYETLLERTTSFFNETVMKLLEQTKDNLKRKIHIEPLTFFEYCLKPNLILYNYLINLKNKMKSKYLWK